MACKHCGKDCVETGIAMQLIGGTSYPDVGLVYVTEGKLINHKKLEPLFADLCTACGEVQRIYVKNPGPHKWYRET